MKVTGSLQTILCAGVAPLVWPKGTTELLVRKEGGTGLEVRRLVRLKPRERSDRPLEGMEGGT